MAKQVAMTSYEATKAKEEVAQSNRRYRALVDAYGAEEVRKEVGYEQYWGGYDEDLTIDGPAMWDEYRKAVNFLAKVVGATSKEFVASEHDAVQTLHRTASALLEKIQSHRQAADSIRSSLERVRSMGAKMDAFEAAKEREAADLARENAARAEDVPALVGRLIAEVHSR